MANKIADLSVQSKYIDQIVTVRGWIKREHRRSKKLIFIDLHDGISAIQIVFTGALAAEHKKEMQLETCVQFTGTLREDKRSLSGYCINDVTECIVLGQGSNDFMKLFNNDSTTPVLYSQRHNILRSPEMGQLEIIKLRAELEYKFQQWFHSFKWTKVSPPAIVAGQSEGGATLFPLAIKKEYFGKPTYLTQSSQFYLEMMVPALNRVWCLEKSFRAEPHCATARHLSEFTHLEAECAFMNSVDELIKHLTSLLCEVIADLQADWNGSFPLPKFEPEQFKQIRYSEAVKLLQTQGFNVEYGQDLTDSIEAKLIELLDSEFLFVTHFPASIKSFYMKRQAGEQGEETLSVDLLARGIGEIIGGSVREDNFDLLLKRMEKEQLLEENYRFYTDLRRYGSCPHAGYGLGFERLIKKLCQASKVVHSVKDCILVPRATELCHQ